MRVYHFLELFFYKKFVLFYIIGVPQHYQQPQQQHHQQQQNHYNMNNGVPNNYYNQQQQQQQKSHTPQPYSHNVLEQVSARAPSSPIVHNRLLIREDIPAPSRPAPPVEISPAPRPPPPPEVDDEEETRAFWERYPLPGASSQPILSAAHNLHQVSKKGLRIRIIAIRARYFQLCQI